VEKPGTHEIEVGRLIGFPRLAPRDFDRAELIVSVKSGVSEIPVALTPGCAFTFAIS
jgi:hypothetical protein